MNECPACTVIGWQESFKRHCHSVQGSLAEQEGFDLVHLCATFSANPFIMAFAQVPISDLADCATFAVHNKQQVLCSVPKLFATVRSAANQSCSCKADERHTYDVGRVTA